MSLLVEFSLYPTDKGESVGQYVSRVVEIIHQSGLPYKLGPMGTTVEGDADKVFEVIRQCLHDLQRDSHRLAGRIDLDWRAQREHGLQQKVESVCHHLGHPVCT
ncbi:MAG TPA: MTH1187 family thiamine-binding protein [Phycisphaerae bacterium]|nr:MTH1187 family thiamine-binding protein [Phycisphaerae bacterium]